VPSDDLRTIAKYLSSDFEQSIKTLAPGQEIFLARLNHHKTEGHYEANCGTYKFHNIPPGTYWARLIWESTMNTYNNKDGKEIPIENIWLDRFESGPTEVIFP